MLISSQISLFLALFIYQVLAQGDNDVKRGKFPYMAFIYYPDETGSEISNNRFFRSAILIRVNWLISASVDNTFLDKAFVGFPKKTLLARIGAVTIDNKITFNEDEGEQESEIIKIVRPQNHVLEKWWETDMTLLKTLAPFKDTSAVSPVGLPYTTDLAGKNCSILVFARRQGNLTEDKVLMNLIVDLVPDDICNLTLKTSMMFCAENNEANKNLMYEPGFCQGNGGGPIICGGEVMGTQTYIDNSCSMPYLYQMLSSWENFITCATEEKCHEETCSKLCTISDKDQPTNQEELLLTATSNLLNEIDATSESSSNVSYVVEVFSQPKEETAASTTEEDTTTTEKNSTVQLDTVTTESEATSTKPPAVEQTTLPVTEQTKVSTERVVQTMTTEGRRKLNSDSDNEREHQRKPVTRNLKKQKRKSSAVNVFAVPIIQYLLITVIVTLSSQCQ